MDGPRPPSLLAPSIWYAAVDAPHLKPLGNIDSSRCESDSHSTEGRPGGGVVEKAGGPPREQAALTPGRAAT
ncbi:hypothetical protein Raf01_51940 [Rugosimonospora africana]|uniref:Uncharacterized protein n=1 Tax=Rugosimonospora africana TaxID=556532 RepID=A0A8J3VS94_9ACTN|nr:hypothetical protein Raf01_51940 [Rugosimonospora africana]